VITVFPSCALIFTASYAVAQTTPSQAPLYTGEPSPTFSAASKLVEVDVVARSKGAPATGLTREDFTLLDNGKPQKFSFFSVRSARNPGPAVVPLAAGVVSNRLERDDEGVANTTVLLIDQENTPQINQAFAIQRIVRFVQMRRKPDRMGIYAFGRDGLQTVLEITSDSDLLNRAARNLKAQDPSYKSFDATGMTARQADGHSAVVLMQRAMDTKHVLQTSARLLAKVPGRKNLIWVTTSFPLVAPELGLDFNRDLEEAARALNDANVALYAVDARGLIGALAGITAISNAESKGPQSPGQLRIQMGRGEPQNPSGVNTMYKLADLTGGLVFFNKSNAIEESIQQAVDDSELTYTLGFYPAQGEKDYAWHDLKVEVSRRGVRVRYRENYFASKTPAERLSLDALLEDPLDATQLQLVAETHPDPARPGFYEVRLSVDLHDIHLEKQNNIWVGAVDVSFFIEGARTARKITRKIEIPDAQLAAALEKGIVVNDSIAAGALRIVAQDGSTGAAGSVRITLGKR
jgi:VWFA-related protein